MAKFCVRKIYSIMTFRSTRGRFSWVKKCFQAAFYLSKSASPQTPDWRLVNAFYVFESGFVENRSDCDDSYTTKNLTKVLTARKDIASALLSVALYPTKATIQLKTLFLLFFNVDIVDFEVIFRKNEFLSSSRCTRLVVTFGAWKGSHLEVLSLNFEISAPFLHLSTAAI